MTLVSDVFGLRLGEEISAEMGLETPQIMVRWLVAEDHPDIDTVTIRRSRFRYPESVTDGDSVIAEAQTDQANIRSSYSDIDVDPEEIYYYTVFFTEKGPYSMDLDSFSHIPRLGLLRGIYTETDPDRYWILARSEEGSPVIWLYDKYKELVEDVIDLSTIVLETSERVVSVVRYTYSSPNRTFDLLTSKRYIKFTVDETAEVVEVADLTHNVSLLGVLSPGFQVRGGAYHGMDIAILDSANEEIKVIDTSGSLVSTVDLSGMVLPGNYYGLDVDAGSSKFLIGSGKVIYAIDDGLTTPDNTDIDALYPVRYTIDSDFFYDSSATALLILSESIDDLMKYDYEDLSAEVQMEEIYSPGPGVVGLWRLDEDSGDLVDESGNANDASLSGSPTQGVSGKFDSGVEFLDVDDYIDLSDSISLFDSDDGFIRFWYKAPYEGYSVSSNVKFFKFSLNIAYEIYMELQTDGTLYARFTRAGGVHPVSDAIPSNWDDGRFHSYEFRWVGGIGGDVYLIYDGQVLDTYGPMAGVWSGTPTVFNIGGDSSDSIIGTFDEVVFGAGLTFSTFSRYQTITSGHRAHALSGRTYDADYQHWRNRLRKEFDEYLLRNDFRVQTLPQNKVLSDGEVIFREDAPDVTFGEFSSLCRMFGLMLDRHSDRRKDFMRHLTPRKCEAEFLKLLGRVVSADDMDPDWNADMQRRHLEVMYYCFHRGGTLDAFKRLVRHLGFRMLCPDAVVGDLIQHKRIVLDSCADTSRPNVPFDETHWDSSEDDVAYVDVQFKFYKQNYSSSVGETSVPATRQLDDAGATFTADAEVGSLIIINDADDDEDNGQYIVTAVNSDTQVEVDRDFPVGSLSGLSYRLHWRVPVPDPYNNQLITRLKRIKVKWQKLEVIE